MIINKIKLIGISFLIISLFFLLFGGVKASENKELHFFWIEGCPFCQHQKEFLVGLKERHTDLKIFDYSISEEETIPILSDFIDRHKGSEKYHGVVPLTFIDNKFFVGFNDAVGEDIERAVIYYQKNIKNNQEIVGGGITIPIIGEIDLENWSLGTLAITIGIIDGFNVCSLGALVLILTLVLGLKSRKLTLILGGMFIFISVFVYGLLVFMWHQIFSILMPYVDFMETIIAIAALLGAFYFLRQFFKFIKKGAVCDSQSNSVVQKAIKRIQKIFKERKNIWALLGGVCLFAVIVTIVEFPCTAIFPVIFTGILVEANIPLSASIFYILLYLLFYMLDELAIFLIAVYTKKIWISSGKFMPIISLLGAGILFFIAYYYLFVL